MFLDGSVRDLVKWGLKHLSLNCLCSSYLCFFKNFLYVLFGLSQRWHGILLKLYTRPLYYSLISIISTPSSHLAESLEAQSGHFSWHGCHPGRWTVEWNLFSAIPVHGLTPAVYILGSDELCGDVPIEGDWILWKGSFQVETVAAGLCGTGSAWENRCCADFQNCTVECTGIILSSQ